MSEDDKALIEWLTMLQAQSDEDYAGDAQAGDPVGPMEHRYILAADRIKKLAAALARAEKAEAQLTDGSFYQEKDIDALMNQRDAALARAEQAEAKAKRLRCVIGEIKLMAGAGCDAPNAADRWCERIEDAARDALAATLTEAPKELRE